jgi:biopolymer transport protein TolR
MAKEPEKLSAQQRSKIRRLSEPKELDPAEEGGELNIVPFLDIITNVLIDTFPPKLGGSGMRAPTTPTLGLSVLVVPEGFSVKARGGNVAPGCSDTGPGLAVAKVNGDYDFTTLNQCVTKLKHLSPEFATESQVTISANPNIPYQAIISTMDAVRKSAEGEELFPDVNFGVAR